MRVRIFVKTSIERILYLLIKIQKKKKGAICVLLSFYSLMKFINYLLSWPLLGTTIVID